MTPMVPDHARHLFWDTNLETFDPSAFPRYTIARALEHGTERDVAWVRELFGEDAMLVMRVPTALLPLQCEAVPRAVPERGCPCCVEERDVGRDHACQRTRGEVAAQSTVGTTRLDE